MPPPPTATESAIQQALADDEALDNVYAVLVRESDGHELTVTKGLPNNRYISSSTVKPISGAAMLWGVDKGWYALDDLIIDLVPEYDALATSNQRDVEIQHLMSFTSGLFQSVNPSANSDTWAEFVDNCASLATASSDPDRVPGYQHIYSTDQHALMSVAMVNASPYSDYEEFFTAFAADTGLFPGVTWSTGSIFGANSTVRITAKEYADFLRAIFNETVLTPALCQDLLADAIPDNPIRTGAYAWLNNGGMDGEDWHFGRGIWLEQRNADWDPSEMVTRWGTIGVGGQYAYHDTVTGVTLVVSVTFPDPSSQFIEGLRFARSIDALVATWSAE
jgi:CubicO group peptidase (beta-lactamase class C family)